MEVSLEGRVVSGMMKGRLFLGMEEYRERFQERLGFKPFPGTLNLRLEGKGLKAREELLSGKGIRIDGFEREGKSYGGVTCFLCRVKGVKGAIILPDKSRHEQDILEVISPENLRERLDLRDGDMVRVEV